MIAYFLLLHRFPDQFKRLFRAIYVPGNVYLIHVDRNAGSDMLADVTAFLQPYQGVEILKSHKALWGGYSLVDAELRGMKRLLEMDQSWSHFINLSGQDFPLKSQSDISAFLSRHPDTQFMHVLDQARERPDTMNRISRIFVEAFNTMIRTHIPRRFLAGATPYIGTQWKIVSRKFCAFVCHDPSTSRFKRFYRHSFIADESFFQTVLMNVFPKGKRINNDLRAIDWVPDGVIKLRPRTFVLSDFKRLTQSDHLFARKFDAQQDSAILDALEKHIAEPRALQEKQAAPLVLLQTS